MFDNPTTMAVRGVKHLNGRLGSNIPKALAGGIHAADTQILLREST
jgi:hypothetical protein